MSSSPVEFSIAPQGRDPYSERRPPYSEDAEQAVLAAMLMDGDAIMRAAEYVNDTMFYAERHRRIFRALVAITERGAVADPLTVADELDRRGELSASGGKEYIALLVDAVPTAANVEFHARIVREKALLRSLIEVSTSIVPPVSFDTWPAMIRLPPVPATVWIRPRFWIREVEELIDAGDEVVAVIREREVGRASGVPVETTHLAVWTLADGKVVQMQMFDDRQQALEAAGLRE